jgi:hypothetical protein
MKSLQQVCRVLSPSALYLDMPTAPLQCGLLAALASKLSLVAPSIAWARKVCVLRLI